MISSSSRWGATTVSEPASRRMKPRRSSALTARDAVSRVVETRTASSESTGAGRITSPGEARARRRISAWTRPTADTAARS